MSEINELKDVLGGLKIDFGEVKTTLANIVKQFDKISEGKGFPRCVERDQRIIRLEQDAIEAKRDIRDMKKDLLRLGPLETTVLAFSKNRDAFDVWLIRVTWAVVIVGIIKWAFWGHI